MVELEPRSRAAAVAAGVHPRAGKAVALQDGSARGVGDMGRWRGGPVGGWWGRRGRVCGRQLPVAIGFATRADAEAVAEQLRDQQIEGSRENGREVAAGIGVAQ